MRRQGPIEYEIYLVGIDEALCVGCGKCFDICPTNVFEMVQRPEGSPRPASLPGHPPVERLAVAVRAEHCLYCQGCVGTCPPQAITIVEI